MSRRLRMCVLAVAAAALGFALSTAFVGLPDFGSVSHAYRTAAVQAAVSHNTANVVSSVNFDQRGMDTLGEETIFFASVLGAAALLRPSQREQAAGPSHTGEAMEAIRLLGYVMLPVVLIIGLDVIAHGHVTPGGGFQGGVIVASGVHLLYVAGSYRSLDRLRPVHMFEHGEAIGAAAFVCLGIAGVIATLSFLANIIPTGTFGQLFSGGTVPLLNGVVGIEVASGVIVLIAKFLDQAILLGRR